MMIANSSRWKRESKQIVTHRGEIVQVLIALSFHQAFSLAAITFLAFDSFVQKRWEKKNETYRGWCKKNQRLRSLLCKLALSVHRLAEAESNASDIFFDLKVANLSLKNAFSTPHKVGWENSLNKVMIVANKRGVTFSVMASKFTFSYPRHIHIKGRNTKG